MTFGETIVGSVGDDTIQGGEGNDNLQGEAGNDLILGGAGNDELIGHAGNDTLDGGAGRDLLFGNSGDDVYIFGWGSHGNEVYDSVGNDTIRIDALPAEVRFTRFEDSRTLFINLSSNYLAVREYFSTSYDGQIENIAFSDGTVWHLGDVLDVVETQYPAPRPVPEPEPIPEPEPAPGMYLTGTEGEDLLEGGTGHDTLDGGLGNDGLVGGKGNDLYLWTPRGDEDLIFDIGGRDSVHIGALASELTFCRDVNDPQTLVLSTGTSTLRIAYYFVPGVEEDESHIESIVFADGTAWDLNQVLKALSPSSPLPVPEPEPDPIPQPVPEPDPAPRPDPFPSQPYPEPVTGEVLLGGKGHDSLVGGLGDDTLLGGEGNDTLAGGAGDDLLMSGKGKDCLVGGAGEDIFVFSKKDLGAGKMQDVINDFETTLDLIDLSGVDANSASRKNDAFTKLLSGKTAFTTAGQLRYDAKKGILYGNTDKDAAAEFQILISNKPSALSLDDLVL